MQQQYERRNIDSQSQDNNILDELDPNFPLSDVTIPKLQDINSERIAHQVDDLLLTDKHLS